MECPSSLIQLLETLYGLSPSETEVIYYLCREEARASAIAEDLGKDRSTVQRYLSKLRATGLIERESVVEEGKKGRYYVYRVPDKEEMKEEVRERLDEWRDEKLEELQQI